MSAHNQSEFEQLLAAHANRELDAHEVSRLDALSQGDPVRLSEIRGVTEVHRQLDAEKELYQQVLAPLEPREQADPVFQRLSRRAARTESALRAMSAHTDTQTVVRPARIFTFPRVAASLAAAAIRPGPRTCTASKRCRPRS